MIGAGYPFSVTVPCSTVWLKSISRLVIPPLQDRISRGLILEIDRATRKCKSGRPPAGGRPLRDHIPTRLSKDTESASVLVVRIGSMDPERHPIERKAAMPNAD